MKSYKSLRAQIAKLEKQAETMRRNEVKSVVADLKKTIAAYGLTAEELGFGAGAAPARRGRKPGAARRGAAVAGAAKYRDPATGQTWTGRGRPPTWIVGAKDRTAFLIDAAPAEPAAPAAPRRAKAAAKPAAKRAGRKSAAKPAPKAAAKKSRRGRKAATKTAAVQIEGGVAME